jgi:nucleoside-diphosphate-sugar epimerase
MNKVLLTGASGFIGRHCIPFLQQAGFEVYGVSSEKQPDFNLGIKWYRADLLNNDAVSEVLKAVKPTHLLHLAWSVNPSFIKNSEINLQWVSASLHLIHEFVNHNGQRAVCAGTCFEYDWNYNYCSESITPLVPATLYGTCKHSLNLMIDNFSIQTGLSFAWARIFFLYGPFEHPQRLVAYVINSLLRSSIANCSSGIQARDYLFVEDVADSLVELLKSDIKGPINIASGIPVTVKYIVQTIAQQMSNVDSIKFQPEMNLEENVPYLYGDTRRLTQELKWKPQFDLERGIEKTIRWWQDRLK